MKRCASIEIESSDGGNFFSLMAKSSPNKNQFLSSEIYEILFSLQS